MLKTVSNVSKVYDEVEREPARLYNPFIITLAKTPVHLTYPYYYRGVSMEPIFNIVNFGLKFAFFLWQKKVIFINVLLLLLILLLLLLFLLLFTQDLLLQQGLI